MDGKTVKHEFKFQRFRKVLVNIGGRFSRQSERSKILDISQSTLSRMEESERDPTIEDLLKVCENSAYSPADFFELKQE